MSETLAVRNPRTGETDYEIPVTGSTEIAAVAAELRGNQPAWRELGLDGRIEVLQRFKRALAGNGDSIVAALSTDTGRHAVARQELGGLERSIDRWCADAPHIEIGRAHV